MPRPADTITPSPWPALRAARHAVIPRRPLILRGPRGPVAVGSVAEAHLPALADWPQWITIGPEAVTLDFGAEIEAITTRWATVNEALRAQGLIVAWRDEPYGVWDEQEVSHATIERAASRFWGTLTLGAHASGYVADASGRPTHLWIAQRSPTKATDPGKYDNLIGGGVPEGQSPQQALVREGWEEAGLQPAQMSAARAGGVLCLQRDIAEGLQHEWLYAYDLQLPPDLQPRNQDGEVAAFHCLPLHEALALAAGEQMTVDAALVTLDFALRHALLPVAQRQRLAAGLARRRVDNALQAF